MRQKPTLGAALRQAAGHQEPVEEPRSTRHAARVGKIMVSAYMPPEVRSSIRLIQAQCPELTLQDLMVEALNDLFAKYGVPQAASKD